MLREFAVGRKPQPASLVFQIFLLAFGIALACCHPTIFGSTSIAIRIDVRKISHIAPPRFLIFLMPQSRRLRVTDINSFGYASRYFATVSFKALSRTIGAQRFGNPWLFL
jgi:hypothetical protein